MDKALVLDSLKESTLEQRLKWNKQDSGSNSIKAYVHSDKHYSIIVMPKQFKIIFTKLETNPQKSYTVTFNDNKIHQEKMYELDHIISTSLDENSKIVKEILDYYDTMF